MLLLLCLLAVLVVPVLGVAQDTLNRGVLENPGGGKHYSGIGAISGWHCLEGRLTVSFNGGEQIPRPCRGSADRSVSYTASHGEE